MMYGIQEQMWIDKCILRKAERDTPFDSPIAFYGPLSFSLSI